jgi:hypothetical protein
MSDEQYAAMKVSTLITHEADGGARTIATTLALRRANAGRNVLLLQQQKSRKQANQYNKENQRVTWLATEMKEAAQPRLLSFSELFNECKSAGNACHDLVIEMPTLTGPDAKAIFAMTDTLVVGVPAAKWNRHKCGRCIKQLNLARSCQQSMSVLVMIDEIRSLSAQEMINRFTGKVPDLHFIFIPPDNDLSLTHLYKAIFSRPTIGFD